jgi:hypothetical protein
LAPRRGAAYHDDRLGQPLHRPDVTVGKGVLATRERDPARVATHAEDELLALHASSVAEREGVPVEKANVAGPVEHAYARGF